jgi:glycerol-3-phosphate O-acyltransferase
LVRCERLLATLRGLGARTAPVLVTTAGELRSDAIREAAQMFADAELLEINYPAEVGSTKRNKPRAGRGAIYTVPGDKRLKLDGSKNIIIHFFVERALVALALLLPPGADRSRMLRDPLGHSEEEARARVQELSRLFKYEFRFRADASFDTIFEETVTLMVQDGDLSRRDQRLAPGVGRAGWTGHQWLMTYAGLLRNFVESYRVAARGLAALEKGPLDAKDLLKQTLSTGRLMYLSGEVERAEAISKPLIQNAFAAFQDLGYVTQHAGQMQLPDASAPAGADTSSENNAPESSAPESAPDSEQAQTAHKGGQKSAQKSTTTGHTPRCLEECIAKYLDREVPA